MMTTNELDKTQKTIARALALIKANDSELSATVNPEYITETVKLLDEAHELMFHEFYQSKREKSCKRVKTCCSH